MSKKININEVKDGVLLKIDEHWIKMDRDRRNAMYINEKVKEHLVWTGAVRYAEGSADTDEQINSVNVKGHLPHIYECATNKLASYRNALLKSPEAAFEIESDIDTQQEYAVIQKHYLISKMKKGKVFEAYNDALMKQIWRGESILFHQWGKIKSKQQVITQKIGKDGNPQFEEDGLTPQYDVEMEEYDAFEGVIVKAIEPCDFVFDVTKISAFSSSNYNQSQFNHPSCGKIVRTWMSLSAIKEEYDISTEDKNVLKDLITSDIPKTERNFDDFSNQFNYRIVNGDMIEVLHWLGDLHLSDGTVLKDYSIITAGNKVLLKCEESPYSRCPIVWMPDLVDFTTRRGISSLIVGIDYNETATQVYETGKKQLEFAVNPAFFARKGAHPVNNKKSINPGEWVEIDSELGDVEYPVEITSYKNIPMAFDFQEMFEKYIQQAIGTNKNMMGNIENPNMTATQTNEMISGSNNRTEDEILTYCNMVLIPSIEIISTMFAENTPIGKEEQVKIPNVQAEQVTDAIRNVKIPNANGQGNIQQVTDAIRKGKYNFTIGSAQCSTEEKAKLQALQPIVEFMVKMFGTKFNDTEIWNYAAGIQDIVNPSRFLQQGNDPQVQQLQQQLQQTQQQAQGQIQQLQQQQQQLLQNPDVLAQKIRNDIVALTITKDSSMPQDLKDYLMKQLSISPTSEMIQDAQKEFEQNQQKQISKQKQAMQMQNNQNNGQRLVQW